MGAFRKRNDIKYRVPSAPPYVLSVPITKTVVSDSLTEPTPTISYAEKSVDEYSQSLMLPHDEDYLLRDMIASGNIPQEVPVAGILDSNDPCDIKNVGVTESLFNQLSSEVEKKVSEPSPSPSSAEPIVNS